MSALQNQSCKNILAVVKLHSHHALYLLHLLKGTVFVRLIQLQPVSIKLRLVDSFIPIQSCCLVSEEAIKVL